MASLYLFKDIFRINKIYNINANIYFRLKRKEKLRSPGGDMNVFFVFVFVFFLISGMRLTVSHTAITISGLRFTISRACNLVSCICEILIHAHFDVIIDRDHLRILID